ncbi:MYND-type domain-containing protein [Pseudoscourfieldia marina]
MNPRLYGGTASMPASPPSSPGSSRYRSFNNSLEALFRRMNSAEVPRFDAVKADLKKAREHILEQARITRIENAHASESNAVVRKQAVMAWEEDATDLDAFAVYRVTRIQKNGIEAHIDVKLGVSNGRCGREPMSLVPDFSTSGLSVHKAQTFRDAVLLTALIDRLDDGEMCTCDALVLVATGIMQQMHMNAAVASLISLCLPFCEAAQGEVTFDSCCMRQILGESYESMGKPSRAVDVYQELCKIAEVHGDPVACLATHLNNLGVALRRTGDKRGAVKAYTRALQGEDDDLSIDMQQSRSNLIIAAGLLSAAGMSTLAKMLGGERRVSAALGGANLFSGGIDRENSPNGLRAFAFKRLLGTGRARRGGRRANQTPNNRIGKVIYYDDSDSEQRVRVAFAKDLPWFQAAFFDGGRENSNPNSSSNFGVGADDDDGASAAEMYAELAQRARWLQVPERYTTFCDMCGTESIDLKKCGGCGSRAYCSRECQLNDWKEHGGGHKHACTGNNKLKGKAKKHESE